MFRANNFTEGEILIGLLRHIPLYSTNNTGNEQAYEDTRLLLFRNTFYAVVVALLLGELMVAEGFLKVTPTPQ